jgi:UDP-N-acetyl-D-glucosamine dehydrogenase
VDSTLDRIQERRAVVGIVGLGYVGLPLAVEFCQAGFTVVGLDVDRATVDALNAGVCHIPDVDAAVFRTLVGDGRFRATDDPAVLGDVDCVSICVPTPLGKTKDPDISFVVDAAARVAKTLRAGQLVVLESTVYPGTTEELLLPMLEAGGLRVGRDFYLAFSPERVDPGNPRFNIHTTAKVIGGITGECSRVAAALYGAIVETVVPVSSPKVAELTKLLENTFRAVNIALVNELAQMAAILDVDVWEVIKAAATKPFGYMPFYPGPGLGGHCIPVDPQYLAWKLRSLNYRARFVELASEVNSEMPHFVVDQITAALNDHEKCLKGSKILLLGVAYKQDVGDVRESPALDIIDLLRARHADIRYVDSYVPALALEQHPIRAVALTDELLAQSDCVVIVTAHTDVDYGRVVRNAPLVVDTRNATEHVPQSDHVWRLTRPSSREVRSAAAPVGVTG